LLKSGLMVPNDCHIVGHIKELNNERRWQIVQVEQKDKSGSIKPNCQPLSIDLPAEAD
jgi:hypothetical protein